MSYGETMSTMWTARASTRGMVQGHEIRTLRSGDGTHPSTNLDLLDTAIVASHGYFSAGANFIPGSLIVR